MSPLMWIIIGSLALLVLYLSRGWIKKAFFSVINSKHPVGLLKKDYICPECGSNNWKFANPLKGANGTINLPSFVNNFVECRDCGNIGPFYIVDKENVKKVQKSFRKK